MLAEPTRDFASLGPDAAWRGQGLAQTRLLTLDRHEDTRGTLVALDFPGLLPGPVERMFLVSAEDSERGEHALLTCWQALVCVSGHCDVTCDDGWSFRRYRLARPEQVLVVPPAIWRSVTYPADGGSALLALCNRPYDRDDYISDYRHYLTLRGRRRPQPEDDAA